MPVKQEAVLLLWFFDAVVLSNFLFADAVTLLRERYRNKGMITREVYDEISAGFAEYRASKRTASAQPNTTL